MIVDIDKILLKIYLVFFYFPEGNKFPAGTFVETAEHLIVFQTEYLNSDDQTLHTADEQVSEDHNDPVR